jgi:transcriptional regulator with XRE-family HTH domain
MTSRVGPVRRAIRVAAEDETRVRAELNRARQGAGLSRETVGRSCGMSRTIIERIEAGSRPTTVREFAAFGAVVGMDVRLRAYVGGDPIRDAGQQRLLGRLRPRLHVSLRWSTEVPLPIEGDLRAWDALIQGPGWRVGVEAETVLDDIQALERRLALKRRDGAVDHVILVVADTKRNRRAFASAATAFGDLPLRTREILAGLRDGRDPGQGGIVIL